MIEPKPPVEEKMPRQMAYGKLAGAYIPVAEDFFASFLHSARTQKPSAPSDQFLKQFLTYADSYCNKASQAVAALLHESSNQKEIRETAEHVLVRLVRNRCFESLDALLVDYAGLLLSSGQDLRSIHGNLGDSRLRDEIGAVVAAQAGGEAGKRVPPQRAKDAAVLRILDCLVTLDNVPRELLDYGAAKLFGGETDYTEQAGFIFNITEALREKRDEAVSIVENFDAVKQRKWEDMRAADLAAIKDAARNSLMKTADRKSGFGSLVIGVICGLLDWAAFASGSSNQYVVIGAIVVGALGIFFLYRGITQLIRI